MILNKGISLFDKSTGDFKIYIYIKKKGRVPASLKKNKSIYSDIYDVTSNKKQWLL